MRIGLVIYGRLDTLTGGYLYDRFLVEALRRRGHAVDVISLEKKPYAPSLLDNLSTRLKARLTDRPYDLLLQDEFCHPSLLGLNRCIRARRRTAIVGIVHQVLCRQPRRRLFNLAYRWAERNFLHTMDGLLFASRFNRDMARHLISRYCPMQVAYPGGDRLGRIASGQIIVERSRTGGPLDLVFVGNLSPIKGLHRLLESISHLPSYMWRLTVAGSLAANRRHARRILGEVARLGLASQVRFLGVVDGENLRRVYTAGQVFMMPFAHEGFGIAALEAMAFGLPVVASSAGGVGEFVRHGENGFLVAVGDHSAVRRHLELLYQDRGRLAAMGQAAWRTFAAHPTWEESMARACEFLEKLVTAPNRHF
ncbi:MAG: glycosyltransferase family 4 protein [Hyphomicrobiales bacterium]